MFVVRWIPTSNSCHCASTAVVFVTCVFTLLRQLCIAWWTPAAVVGSTRLVFGCSGVSVESVAALRRLYLYRYVLYCFPPFVLKVKIGRVVYTLYYAEVEEGGSSPPPAYW